MVAIIKTGHSVRSSFNYNENKVSQGIAVCIGERNYPVDVEKMNHTMKLNRLLNQVTLNDNVICNSVHISLNFDPSENHSKELLMDIANAYMEKIGFGQQPYLVYQHNDSEHPHIHIVSIKVRADGSRIDMQNIGKNQSEKARKEIEETFGLVKAESKKTKEQFSLLPIANRKIDYGKTESKKAINGVLNKVLFDYKYSSLAELNAVLGLYNVKADRGNERSRVFKNNGLLYRILDENAKPIGVPIKASDFYSKPTLKFLEDKFKANETRKISDKTRVKNTIQMAFIREHNLSLDRFAKQLEKEGIHTVLRKSETGLVYGITYVDHVTKNVFNGSSLGKEYSAKGILERCEPPIVAENKQQVSERLKAFILENNSKKTFDVLAICKLIDSLLQPEMTYDYLPKQLKKKKKRRIRKGI